MTYSDAIKKVQNETVSILRINSGLIASLSNPHDNYNILYREIANACSQLNTQLRQLENLRIYREVEAQLQSDEVTIGIASVDENGFILDPVEYTDCVASHIVLKPGRKYFISQYLQIGINRTIIDVKPDTIGSAKCAIYVKGKKIRGWQRIFTDLYGRDLYFDSRTGDDTWIYKGYKQT